MNFPVESNSKLLEELEKIGMKRSSEGPWFIIQTKGTKRKYHNLYGWVEYND